MKFEKKLILSVAGTGKTEEIITSLDNLHKSIIITYTVENYENIKMRIIKKFGFIPKNIKIFTYFTFLYKFCFQPLNILIYCKGIDYKSKASYYIKETSNNYYINPSNNMIYHYRLSKFCKLKLLDEIICRIERYFEILYVDEIQDFGANDFDFIFSITKAHLNIYLYGDYNQHTYDTSYDGNINKDLYKDYEKYKNKIIKMNNEIKIDEISLLKSKRCPSSVCNFINKNLKINIYSENSVNTIIKELVDDEEIDKIVLDSTIVKLFYNNSNKYNIKNKNNWGNCKGATYDNVCVALNKETYKKFKKNELYNLSHITKNKFYVACSRTKNNLFFVEESKLEKYKYNI